MVFSGNLWCSLKQVKPLIIFDGEPRMSLEPMQGNRASSPVDLWHTECFGIAVVTSGPYRLVTVFLGTLWSSIKEVKTPFMFDGEHRIALHAMQGNRASFHGEGEVSWFYSSCGRNLSYILKLWLGWPSKTRDFSAMSGLLSSCEGHIRIIFEAC